MSRKVAIIGIGRTSARAVSPDVSYREMIFEAATKAYVDAGISHTDIESFVCNEEDFLVGYSIADEYAPDQMGAVQKPVHTVAGDFLQGLATAYMMIAAGLFRIVAVESHSKASNVKTLDEVHSFALDPIYTRPLNMSAHFVAGLEMKRYLYETATSEEDCARVVVKSRMNALKNPHAAWGAKLTTGDVLESLPVSAPLKELDVANHADGAVVMVVASEEVAKKGRPSKPLWIKGIGWCSDSPFLEMRNLVNADYARLAAERAYKMADIKEPARDVDVFEVDDTYSYKAFQHLEALGLCKCGDAKRRFNEMPINLSGGLLGMGNLFEANGGFRLYEICLQLRGEAGYYQVSGAKTGLVQSWRGVPTQTGAVCVLSA